MTEEFDQVDTTVSSSDISDDESQVQSTLNEQIAIEVGKQLALILPQALDQLVPKILGTNRPPELQQPGSSSGSSLGLRLKQDEIDWVKTEPYPTQLSVKTARKKAKKTNKKCEEIQFNPEPTPQD